ncbi:DUF3180 domain-containing protein [Ornithinimicrobium faecis]|uniref:DUF3180 domain-containing protein n=1 Tax=Ornithinimicrobium faecis TaxID=2934158 RepID=A0ABY4YTL4_9MICO|nr:DUF3180 family protein [Ornithinimicrobium sp. HY1793]USQ79595.1 DUF3180 domain-containing protein [Ornithinimicrobium sp. HY1793]
MAEQSSGVRSSAVVLVAIVSTVVCVLLLRGWQSLGNGVPDVPWIAIAPLGLLILLVLVSGWQVRRYARFRRTEDKTAKAPQRISPERSRGTLVAAQAAALGGGALIGWYLAIALLRLPNADVLSVRDQAIRAAVCAGVALVLALAGLLAQHWCRLPPGENDDDDDEPPRGISYVS